MLGAVTAVLGQPSPRGRQELVVGPVPVAEAVASTGSDSGLPIADVPLVAVLNPLPNPAAT